MRNSKKKTVVPYRCDTPTMLRFMELGVIAEQDDNLFILSFLNTEENTAYLGLLDQIQRDLKYFLTICSWCKKVEIEKLWVEIQAAIQELDLFTNRTFPQLCHSIVQGCATSIMGAAYGRNS